MRSTAIFSRLPRASTAPKRKVAGEAPGAQRLGLIARAGEVRPGLAPVVGAFGGPGEIGRAQQTDQRPRRVIRNIGGEAKFSTRAQNVRQLGNAVVLHEAPLPVPPLRPGI